MKCDLYIGDNPPANIELVSAPRTGDLIIYGGKEHTIRCIAHDADKKKLRVACGAPLDAPEVADENDCKQEITIVDDESGYQ